MRRRRRGHPALTRAEEAGAELERRRAARWPARSRPTAARGPTSAAGRAPVGVLAELGESSSRCTASPTSAAAPAEPAARGARPLRRAPRSSRPARLRASAYDELRGASAERAPAAHARRRERAREADLLRVGLERDRGASTRSPARTSRCAPRTQRLGHADSLRAGASAGPRRARRRRRRREPRAGVPCARRPRARALEPVSGARPGAGRARAPVARAAATSSPTSPRPRVLPRRRRRRPGPARPGRRSAGPPCAALTRMYGDDRRRRAGLGRARPPRRLDELDGADDRIGELDASGDAARRARGSPRALTAARAAAGDDFGDAVTARARAPGDAQRASSGRAAPPRPTRTASAGRRRPASGSPGTASTTSSSCSRANPGAAPRTLAKARLRRRAVPRHARHRGRSPAGDGTRCRRSSSTRSTPASAAGRARDRRAGWRGSPGTPRCRRHPPAQVAAFADRHLVVAQGRRRRGHPQRRARVEGDAAGARAGPDAGRRRRLRGRARARPRAARQAAHAAPDADARAGPRGAAARLPADRAGERVGTTGAVDVPSWPSPSAAPRARPARRGRAPPASTAAPRTSPSGCAPATSRSSTTSTSTGSAPRPWSRCQPAAVVNAVAVDLRPLPEPRPGDPARRRHPAARRRRPRASCRLKEGDRVRARRRDAVRRATSTVATRRRRTTPRRSQAAMDEARAGPVRPARGVRRRTRWSTCARSASCCSTASACPTSRTDSTAGTP